MDVFETRMAKRTVFSVWRANCAHHCTEIANDSFVRCILWVHNARKYVFPVGRGSFACDCGNNAKNRCFWISCMGLFKKHTAKSCVFCVSKVHTPAPKIQKKSVLGQLVSAGLRRALLEMVYFWCGALSMHTAPPMPTGVSLDI